jgi:hypothetical protein
MTRRWSDFAIGLCLVASAAGCSESNPLIGRWQLLSGAPGCNQAMDFKSTAQSMTFRGATSSAPVSGYVVDQGKVIVGGSPGVIGTFTYEFKDANTIHQPNMSGACVWKRA